MRDTIIFRFFFSPFFLKTFYRGCAFLLKMVKERLRAISILSTFFFLPLFLPCSAVSLDRVVCGEHSPLARFFFPSPFYPPFSPLRCVQRFRNDQIGLSWPKVSPFFRGFFSKSQGMGFDLSPRGNPPWVCCTRGTFVFSSFLSLLSLSFVLFSILFCQSALLVSFLNLSLPTPSLLVLLSVLFFPAVKRHYFCS